MTYFISDYPYSKEQIQERIRQYEASKLTLFTEPEAIRFALNCIDLTTLEGSDTPDRVTTLCQKAVQYQTAAVCVYPPFISISKKALKNTPIRVAAVAGAFPAGQSPIEVKLMEVGYAVEQGADEIDMVISRGKMLDGLYDEVFAEIVAIREKCKGKTLKVILETGELVEPQLIYHASQLAMAAGADFIKTSTGKVAVNATPEALVVMLDAIKDHAIRTGVQVGIKPAGGISDEKTAIFFLKIVENVLGKEWFTPNKFRIGTSKLADLLHKLR
ncbi:MAG TPA: deoxyribose-phosphate aldolase [Bacteroidales bacterium]|nr:deoxyribose-phosphate aldolase [Bacteroidales bacterium]